VKLRDFGAFFILTVFVFGAGFFMQEKHDLCEEIKFKSKKCELQKKVEEAGKCCSL